MNQADTLIWAGWTLCLGLSFVLSGMEAGVFALNRVRLRQQARTGHKTAIRLMKFLNNPEQFLWTLFIGNTLVNFYILVWILMVLESQLRQWPVALWGAFALVVYAFYTLCDLLPKTLFRQAPNRFCTLFAGPVRWVHIGLRPLVRCVELGASLLLGLRQEPALSGQLFGNREELRVILEESARGFTSDERLLINRVMDLHAVTARQLMKPMQLAVTLNMDTPLSEVFQRVRDQGISRFPVWDVQGKQRRIAGMLDLDQVVYRDDLDPAASIARFVKPAVFVDENLPVERALRRMRRTGQQLVVVVGRDQRELGLLSMQDVLKRIFGEVSF
ncbi:MAG: CNNM domain-containing protein [Verrucomicrobia bacterium]|jgi:CBS domain containing-hemolysin-like protein|nr:CNNM domain-containing protein [Verrucomicrobiota bacterium]